MINFIPSKWFRELSVDIRYERSIEARAFGSTVANGFEAFDIQRFFMYFLLVILAAQA